jgi:hypothetical protein
VVQLGGVIGSSRQEVQDDPLMSVGDHVALFLRFDQLTGNYGVLGGPQGRFLERNGLVYSLDVLYPDRNIFPAQTISGVPEATFIVQLLAD